MLAITRDESVSEDLFQEFVVRVLRGDLCRVSPSKGRFRDYVKSILINLVNDHFRNRHLRTVPLNEQLTATMAPSEDDSEVFEHRWREEMLRQTWQDMRERHPLMYTVMRTHVENVDAPAVEKAKDVADELGTSWTANRFRVCLHRARAKFAQILESKVAATLDDPTDDQLCRELRHLRLLRYCRRSDASKRVSD